MILWDSLVYDPADHYLVLFGGCTVTICPYPSQTWTYSAGGWKNITSLSPQPPARSYGMMTYDGSTDAVLLFGGGGASSTLADTWEFSGGVWKNVTSTAGAPPSPRWGGVMVYDPADQESVLFGGAASGGAMMSDTWTFSNGQWANATTGSSPPPRWEASMVWDDSASAVLMMDGCGPRICPLNDSWEFTNGQWTNVTSSFAPLPPGRSLAALTYDAATGVLWLFGGFGTTKSLADTWEYTNGGWHDQTAFFPTAPHPREGSGALADTIAWTHNGSAVWPYELLFGGDWMACTTCPLNGLTDTWAFEPPPSAHFGSPPGSVEVGQTVTLTGTGSSGTPPYAFHWEFGDGTGASGSTVTHAYLSSGNWTLTLQLTDAAQSPATVSTVVPVTPGPAVTGTATPTATDVGHPVVFAAGASSGSGSYGFNWSFADGAAGTGSQVVHTFAVTGTLVNVLTVRDSVGGGANSTVVVTVQPLPSVSFHFTPTEPGTGSSIAFSASVTGGTAPVSLTWNWGDGTSASTAAPTHAFSAGGTYRVTVTAEDAAGASAASSGNVTVAGGGAPSSSQAPTGSVSWGLLLGSAAAGVIVGATVALVISRRTRRPPVSSTPPPAKPAPRAKPWDEGAIPKGPETSRPPPGSG